MIVVAEFGAKSIENASYVSKTSRNDQKFMKKLLLIWKFERKVVHNVGCSYSTYLL